MKKALSLFLVIAMLMSAMICAIPTSAKATAANIEYIDVPYFEPTAVPTIDGYISEAEWGEASFTVEATDCESEDAHEPYSRFLYWRTGARSDYNSFEYTVWLRWSNNYFYMGVKVKDPDKHSLKNGTSNTWDGDAIQTRIDKQGANSVVKGADFTIDMGRPWAQKDVVPDFLFGYCQIAGGFSEAWENTTNRGMTSFSANPLGTALCVVAPAGSSYSTDTQAGITTYEVAIPWAYIMTGDVDAAKNQITTMSYQQVKTGRQANNGGIGREFGMSIAVLDDGNNPDAKWDAYMNWGYGITNVTNEKGVSVDANATTGSNAITLSDKKVTPSAGYTTYNCQSLLDATFSTKNVDAPNTYYDYLAGDVDKTTKVDYSALSTLTYDTDPDGDLSAWGAPEYKGHVTNIGGEHGNVLDYSNFIGNDKTEAATDIQTYIDSRDGEIRYLYPTSYTFEFDIQYTGTVPVTEYETALHNWFGGADQYSYTCGYYFNDSMFKILNTHNESQVIATKAYNLKKGNWYKWRFQYDNESCNARLWIDDLSTEADNANGEKWGEMIFNTCWRYFYYSSEDTSENGALMIFRMMNVQCMYDNVKIYNFASFKQVAAPAESSGAAILNGGNGGSVATGDNMLFLISTAAITVLAVTGVAVVIKRRREDY